MIQTDTREVSVCVIVGRKAHAVPEVDLFFGKDRASAQRSVSCFLLLCGWDPAPPLDQVPIGWDAYWFSIDAGWMGTWIFASVVLLVSFTGFRWDNRQKQETSANLADVLL